MDTEGSLKTRNRHQPSCPYTSNCPLRAERPFTPRGSLNHRQRSDADFGEHSPDVEPWLMNRDQNGMAPVERKIFDKMHDACSRKAVETRCRFIHEHDRRRRYETDGDIQSSFLTPRQTLQPNSSRKHSSDLRRFLKRLETMSTADNCVLVLRQIQMLENILNPVLFFGGRCISQ